MQKSAECQPYGNISVILKEKKSIWLYLYNTAHDIIQSVFLYLQASSVGTGTKLRGWEKKEQTMDLRQEKKKKRF